MCSVHKNAWLNNAKSTIRQCLPKNNVASAEQEISCLYGIRRFVIVFTTGRNLSWASWTKFIPSNSIFARFILILSFHLRLVSQAILYLEVFKLKCYMHFSSPHAWHTPRPRHLSSLDHLNVTLRYKLRSSSSWSFLHCPITYSCLSQLYSQLRVFKVKLFLFLTNHHVMKEYGRVEAMTDALDGGEWSDSRPGRFTPEKEPLVRIG